MLWCGVVWTGVELNSVLEWNAVVWCAWCGVEWHRVVWCGVAWSGVYGLVWSGGGVV